MKINTQKKSKQKNVLNKYFTLMQKKELKNFKSHFSLDKFDIHFLQMIDAN